MASGCPTCQDQDLFGTTDRPEWGLREFAAGRTGKRETMQARVEIHYCRGCRWLTRAAWVAQELLITFDAGELAEVALRPSATGGTFDVLLDGEMIFSRQATGRFPELKELKQLVRDRVAPERDLGHSDTPLRES